MGMPQIIWPIPGKEGCQVLWLILRIEGQQSQYLILKGEEDQGIHMREGRSGML